MTALATLLPGGRRVDVPCSLLVVRWGNIGDIVVTLPAFHALRRLYPHARLVLLTTPTQRGVPGARELLANDKTFDDMIVYYQDESRNPSFLLDLRRKLSALHIDLAVLFANQRAQFLNVAKYLFLLSSVGVRRFAGFSVFSEDDFQMRQLERSMRIVNALGEAPISAPPWLQSTKLERDAVGALIPPEGDRPLVVMHCGSKPPVNRWKAENFIELGRRLAARGVRIALTGGGGEAPLTQSIADAIGSNTTNLAGKTSVTELLAVVERADLVISNNTGTMHLAYALGRPLVNISSARDWPMVWEPYGDSHITLRQDIPCAACDLDVCPKYDYAKCLELISVEEVWAAVQTFLARHERKPICEV